MKKVDLLKFVCIPLLKNLSVAAVTNLLGGHLPSYIRFTLWHKCQNDMYYKLDYVFKI